MPDISVNLFDVVGVASSISVLQHCIRWSVIISGCHISRLYCFTVGQKCGESTYIICHLNRLFDYSP